MDPYHSATTYEIRACRSLGLTKSALSAEPEKPWHRNQGRRRPAPGLGAELCGTNMAGAASATSKGEAGRGVKGREGEGRFLGRGDRARELKGRVRDQGGAGGGDRESKREGKRRGPELEGRGDNAKPNRGTQEGRGGERDLVELEREGGVRHGPLVPSPRSHGGSHSPRIS